jgi:hypothetical protein
MRSLTVANSAFRIPDSIQHNNKSYKKRGDYNFFYEVRNDLEFIDETTIAEIIIVEGLIEGLENPKLNDDFFKVNDLLNGQFAIFNINQNRIRFATDFLNINRFAYYQDLTLGILISNNLDDILEIIKCNNIRRDALDYIDPTALIEQLGYQYSTLGNRTLIKEVAYFQSGCIYEIDSSGVKIIAIDSIDRVQLKFADKEFQSMLKSNAELFTKKFSNICFPISGGVDSRITLHSFETWLKKQDTIILTHGEIDDIEVLIGAKLANVAGLEHTSISIQDLYPSREKVQQILHKGWNWVLGKWAPFMDNVMKHGIQRDTLFIFGDTLDLLRAKNLKSLRSRKKRILIQLGLAKLNSSNIYIDDIKNYYFDKVKNEIKITYRNYEALFLKLEINLDDLNLEVVKDLMATMKHVERLFNPTNGYEFEEGLNLIIWGRGTMGNQARYINQYFPCYVAHANRQFIKKIVCVDQTERFEDKLVHRLLKKSKFSKFATSQIPILPYRFPLCFKYPIWAIRSLMDQYYMKLARKYGFSRNRLFKMQNWQTIYSDSQNAHNYRSYFEGLETLLSYPLNYYDNRASGKSRALSEIDLTNAAQIAMILKKMGLKQ